MVNVLFVCMGNICRSPIAQGVFEDLVRAEGLGDDISVDSAGTGSWHIGDPPDPRARDSAKKRGYDLESQRARKITPEDCGKFDHILVMDEENYRTVSALCGRSGSRVRLLLDYAPESGAREVPDPYFGGSAGFEHALDLVESATKGLLNDIRERKLAERG